MITTLTPQNLKEYELIDCGNFEKLERFGSYILIRPEPQAVWDKSLSEKEWEKRAHVRFEGKSPTTGTWKKLKDMPDRWNFEYKIAKNTRITFRLALTSFKHVGIFPEQAANWDFIFQAIGKLPADNRKVLNLFAYTGGASLAARAAGAEVTHLDSIRQVVNWSADNMKLSNLDNIKWVIEDATKFCQREEKRNKTYQGIIIDPPAFGHGPNGESWKLERDINGLLKTVSRLADPKDFFMVLNTYSLGFSSYIIENLFKDIFGKNFNYQFGELILKDSFGKRLPLGVFVQAERIKK
ncbi:MAG: oxidoreductase [Bacteroidetes bacterium HGW-Bacteroidetes-21]|nr:MAG: oxidoreductase [Bacteroidetes bacterium HGW-Bacteroidetes-21]